SAAVRPRELAGHLHGRRAVLAVAVGGMKAHGELRRDHPHVLEFQHEVPMPGVTVVLAVGDELEPELFLHAHDVPDGGLLDAREPGRRELALLRLLACLDQRLRPDQAADMVGAEGRLGAFQHVKVSTGARPLGAARQTIAHAAGLSCRLRRARASRRPDASGRCGRETMTRRKKLLSVALAAGLAAMGVAAVAGSARAQTVYPERVIKM